LGFKKSILNLLFFFIFAKKFKRLRRRPRAVFDAVSGGAGENAFFRKAVCFAFFGVSSKNRIYT